MSTTTNLVIDDTTMQYCASCGIAKGGDIKLKDCSACKLVRYCGVNCQKNHRPQHKHECKKRAAELKLKKKSAAELLHDEILFQQPEGSHFGDCPICCLPLSIDREKHTVTSCCYQTVCKACQAASTAREVDNSLEQKCPFCRQLIPNGQAEMQRRTMKRVKAEDPVAMREHGLHQYHAGNFQNAFEYAKRAADLGDMDAHHNLAVLYLNGRYNNGSFDEKKAVYHFEQAAIAGHPDSRYNLAKFELFEGNLDRAIKHWTIAANLGHDLSLAELKLRYKSGLVSKDVLAGALRGHQAAVDATKSPQREAAEAAHQKRKAARAARQR